MHTFTYISEQYLVFMENECHNRYQKYRKEDDSNDDSQEDTCTDGDVTVTVLLL